MCKFESSQKDETRALSADSSKADSKPRLDQGRGVSFSKFPKKSAVDTEFKSVQTFLPLKSN